MVKEYCGIAFGLRQKTPPIFDFNLLQSKLSKHIFSQNNINIFNVIK